LRDNDFEVLLSKSESFIKDREPGYLDFIGPDAAIFTKCQITNSFCEYIYEVKLNATERTDELSNSLIANKVDLIKGFLDSAPKSLLDLSAKNYSRAKFMELINEGVDMTLSHSFFSKAQFKRNNVTLSMKLYVRPKH